MKQTLLKLHVYPPQFGNKYSGTLCMEINSQINEGITHEDPS
jgi:hypothetical protein